MSYKSNTIVGPIALNTSGDNTMTIASGTNNSTLVIGNSASGAITIDCSTNGITVGHTANAHTTTIGANNTNAGLVVQVGASGSFTMTSATKTSITATNTGYINEPWQPALSEYMGNLFPATGDGTLATIPGYYNYIDTASGFSGSTYTVAKTGKYLISMRPLISVNYPTYSSFSSTDARFYLVVNSTSYLMDRINPQAIGASNVSGVYTSAEAKFSIILPLNANDTLYTQVQAMGSLKNINYPLSGGWESYLNVFMLA